MSRRTYPADATYGDSARLSHLDRYYEFVATSYGVRVWQGINIQCAGVNECPRCHRNAAGFVFVGPVSHNQPFFRCRECAIRNAWIEV